jgi:hypothetical protein
MLSRTGRRKQLQDEDFPLKRRQLLESCDDQHQPSRTTLDNQEPTLIRCLRVIFSSVSAPASLDFIVSECGISVLQDNNTQTSFVSDQKSASQHGPDQPPPAPSADIQLETQLAAAAHLTNEAGAAAEIEDEYDKLWTENTYNDFDWDALERVLTQTV